VSSATPAAIYPFAVLMAFSVASGAIVFWLGRPFKSWIDNPSRLKRASWRALLFLASFLFPFALVATVEPFIVEASHLNEAFAALPSIVRWCAFVLPIVGLWLWMYRGLLKHFLSEAGK